ncbi:tetraprenyl-beta-curcumene synthase family protein [Natranaerobius thermophilus]
MIFKVLPFVNRELNYWYDVISNASSDFLSEQGQLSIKFKKFHCQGGSVYSLYKGSFDEDVARFIVAFQTISDYLDNLCDRSGIYEERSFAKLHQAMLDIFNTDEVNLSVSGEGYYKYYPHTDDDSYLINLVQTCRQELSKFKEIDLVRDDLYFYTKLYTELQIYKHLELDKRESKLKSWHEHYTTKLNSAGNLYWWEFASASGSTLLIFALIALMSKNYDETSHRSILNCYFPWICGLHILLDYLIDQEEDYREQDLNFVFFYPNKEMMLTRLKYFVNKSLESIKELPNADFHKMVVKGLLALYLSDPKIESQGMELLRNDLLSTGGSDTLMLYKVCKSLRRVGVI